MLRASAHTAGIEIDLRSITERAINPNVPAGPQLLDFVDALIQNDLLAIQATRGNLSDVIGPAGAARAALVAGNFEMMNRILDATGVPVPISMGDISTELGLPPFTGRH